MQKVTKILLRDKYLFIAIVVTIAISIYSLIKPSETNGISFFKFSNADKIQHLIAYFCLGMSWFFAIKNSSNKKHSKIKVVIACIMFGIIIEGLQGTLTTYRTADFRDVIANSVGVLLALLVFNIFLSKK